MEIVWPGDRKFGKPMETVSRVTDTPDSFVNLRYYATLARDTHGITAG
jgi:hypothetical protein